MRKIVFYLILISFYLCHSQATVSTHIYSIKGLDTLKMDIYTPKNYIVGDSLPVLLWMHGGSFSGGDKSYPSEKKLGELAAEKGYLGIFISYRLTRKGLSKGFGCDCPKSEKLSTFKSAAIDFLDAAKFVYDNKAILGADTNRLIAAGSSAGAEGMLNAVYMKEYFVEDLIPYHDIKFSGVFSLAGAMVNADYITNSNALPSVFFHGTEDNVVPFGSSSHHFCRPNHVGYIVLDGSATIVEKLKKLDRSYYLHKAIGGKHELSKIPFDHLDYVFNFFEETIFKKEIIQTVRIIKN